MQQNLTELKQAEVVFWREQYKKRFPGQGDDATLRRVYDDIQREIDHERNEEDSIYRRMAGNRQDPELRQAMMRKVEEKRAGLVAAFNEVLESAGRGGVSLSPKGKWNAFNINTGWIFPRLWWSLGWPVVWDGGISWLLFNTPLRLIFVGIGTGFVGAILWALFPSIRPTLTDAMTWLQTVPGKLGEFWYVKVLYYPVVLEYVRVALLRFIRYQKPQR
jgi:hypothetical protein